MPEDEEKKDNNNPNHTWKELLPMFVVMILIVIGVVKFLIPALIPADHSPSTVIEQSKDGSYIDEFFDRFR
jgi:hypothetical protein